MATLEKIRSKGALLVIIIGVALLAFIVGDALTNSRNLFGDHTTVAKVGKEKIDYHEYQRKREELNHRLETARAQNPAQYANFDTQLLGQMAIDELIGTALLDRAVKRTGIRTTPEQLRFYVLENPVNQEALGTIIRQLNASGLSVTTPAQAYEVIFNPKRNNLTEEQMAPFRNAWVAMEEETKQMIARNSYQRLLYGTVKANDLDKKALYNDYVATRSLSLAYHPYGQLDEKEYPVSEAELKEAYAAEKNNFKVDEETKEISFIAVNVAPSPADRAEAQRIAKATVEALRDSAGSLTPALKKDGVATQRVHKRLSDVQGGPVLNYVKTAPRDSVSLVVDNMRGFTVIKMGRRTSEVDSIQLNLVQVAGTALPAKVLARLNAGLALDSLSTAFSPDSVIGQAEQWIPLFTRDGASNAIEPAQLDTLRAAAGRYVSILSTPQGALLAKVVKQSAPVEIVEYDEYTYALNPSTKTVADERMKLEKFLAENATAAKFAENAAKAGYTVQNFAITPSTPAIPRMAGYNQYYPESRQVARWVVIDGKAGEVSGIYEAKDATAPALYAAAVEAAYEDFTPMTNKDVKTYLTNKVRRSKAGDALVKKYQGAGKDMAKVAAAMNVEPRQIPAFRFGRGSGVSDPAVMGRIAGSAPKGALTVVKGDDGVYAYIIEGTSTEAFPYTDASYEQQYFQLIQPQMDQMLRGAMKVKNNSYKFEAGE